MRRVARLDAVHNIDTFTSIDYYYLQDFMSLRVARPNLLLLRNNNNEEEGTRVIRVAYRRPIVRVDGLLFVHRILIVLLAGKSIIENIIKRKTDFGFGHLSRKLHSFFSYHSIKKSNLARA